MKKALFILLISSIILYSLTTCKKDRETSENEITRNYFTLQDTEYTLSDGAVLYDGHYNDLHHFVICMYSNEVSFDPIDTQFYGIGQIVGFLIHLADTVIVSGNYEYNDMSEPVTFYDGGYGINYDFAQDTGMMADFKGGNISIRRDANLFEIRFNVTDENNQSVSGQFKKNLPIFSDDK